MQSRKNTNRGPRKTQTAKPYAQTAPVLSSHLRKNAQRHGIYAQSAQNAFFAQSGHSAQSALFAAHLCWYYSLFE